MIFLRSFLSTLFALWLLQAGAQEPIQLDDRDRYSVGKQVAWLEDKEGTFSLADVRNADKGFVISDKEVLNFNLTRSVHWIRVKVKNNSYFNDWLLQLEFPQNSFVDLYDPAEDPINPIYSTGFLVNFDQRPVNSSQFVFPLDLSAGTVKEIFLRVESDRAKILPLSIVRKPAFEKAEAGDNLLYGIYFGIMGGLLLYNLFLFFGLRDKAYIYYVLFLISSILLFASISGKSQQFMLQDYPNANRLLIEISSALLAFFSAHFTQLFLKIRRYSKLLHLLLNVIKATAVVSLVLIFTIDIMWVQPLLYIMLTADILILLAAGIVSWRMRNTYASYFVIAWLGYMVGGMLTMGRDQGVLPFNFVTNHAAEIGSAMEAILLSLALSKRYQIYRKEKEQAIRRSLQIQQDANENLERKVEERTLQLSNANDRLNEMFRVVSEQKMEIEEKNHDITSSINYARRIQASILPTKETVSSIIPDHFILYKPMDIVSGDFYWLHEADNKQIIVVADCTGHGVPGAFMSMIGAVLLNKIIAEQKVLDPSKILSILDHEIRLLLRQQDSDLRDGMDMAVCIYDRNARVLEFSGAMLPLYYIRFSELSEIKASRFPVGGMNADQERVYEKHTLTIDSSTLIYLSTDGFKDQFGGIKGRKFMASQFREVLLNNHHLPLHEQKMALDKAHQDWKGARHAQTDDVLVLGTRIG